MQGSENYTQGVVVQTGPTLSQKKAIYVAKLAKTRQKLGKQELSSLNNVGDLKGKLDFPGPHREMRQRASSPR